jgi:hypothetical protein
VDKNDCHVFVIKNRVIFNMGEFGAIGGMISSLKDNKNIVTAKKTFRDHKDAYFGKTSRNNKPLLFHDNMTQDEHIRFKLKLESRKRKTNMFFIVMLILVFVLFTVLFNTIRIR